MLDRAAPWADGSGTLPVMRRRLVLIVAVLAAACTRPAPGVLDAADLIAGGVSAMQDVATARFEMTRSGAPVAVQGLVFDSARGRYAAPASADAILRMRAGDLAVELGTVSVAQRTWLTNPLTGRWEELRPGTGFNPAVLFDSDDGWVALLHDLGELEVVTPGGATHHLAGRVPAARVEILTAGLVPGQAVRIDLWLDAAAGHIRRLGFSTMGDAGRSDWVIVLSDFDAPVQIQPPAEG